MSEHKHDHQHAHHQAHGAATRGAALASVATALILLALKGYASWTTESIAMLGSLADTALDLAASLVTLGSVIYAAQPADQEHRFGHGKAEALAALFQVTLVTLSALAILWRSVERFMTGNVTAHAETGIAVSLVAMVATLALLAYQRRAIAKTGSVAIEADHLHYQSDLLLNGAVIAALVLDQYAGIGWADPAFGLFIALWLIRGAWTGAASALDQLMDREWPLERREKLLALAAQHPELKGIHDLRTRTSGMKDFVQFHVWVDGNLNVRQTHDVMDEIEEILRRDFPGVEFLIHPDPEGLVDEGPLGAVDLTADLPSTAEQAALARDAGRLAYFHVDAFADAPFTGNQAAVIPLDGWLADDVMQAMAEENRFAETAFFVPVDRPDDGAAQDGADFELRWFTPQVEVALCGHATLASGHVVLSQQPELSAVRFATRQSGVLEVRRDPDGYALALPAIATAPVPLSAMADAIAALGGPAPLECAAHGESYALLRYADEADVRALAPDMAALAKLGDRQFICTAPGRDHDIVSRVFVPGAGVPEDSVTGSAHAALAPYWAAKLNRQSMTAWQASARGGRMSCMVDGDRVWLTGPCVTVVEGVFRL